MILLFLFCILRVPSGSHEQREVRNFNGAQYRSASLRSSRGHRRGEAEDGHDRLRLPHDPRHSVNGRNVWLKQCTVLRNAI